MIDDVRALFVPELTDGLVAGVLAAALMLPALLVWRARQRPGPVPGAGLLLVGAAAGAIAQQRHIPTEVLLGITGVAAAGALSHWRRGRLIAPLLALPPAWLLAHESSTTPWVQGLVLAAAWLGAATGGLTERAWREHAVTPLLFAITAGGVFLAVPDTEEAAALLGTALPVALLGWPLRFVTLGRTGIGAATALLAWVVAVGGRGRPPSIVGGLACLGLLAGLAAGQSLRSRFSAGRPLRAAPVPIIVVMHGGIVLVASRVAGVSPELRRALPVAVACMVAAAVAGTLLSGPVGSSTTKRDGDSPPVARSLLGPRPEC